MSGGYQITIFIFTGIIIVSLLGFFVFFALSVCLGLQRRPRILSMRAMRTGSINLVSRGLDAKAIESLPVFLYTKNEKNRSMENLDCTICISEFVENEKVKSLPGCKHSFHVDCIDMWLSSHASCPVCRETVTSSNGSKSGSADRKDVAIDIDVGSGSTIRRDSFSSNAESFSSSMRRMLSINIRPNHTKDDPSCSTLSQQQVRHHVDT